MASQQATATKTASGTQTSGVNAVSVTQKPKDRKRIPLQPPHREEVQPKEPSGKGEFNEVHRIASSLWTDEGIPFKLYEVQKRPAHILEVHIIRGKGITKGWFREIMDIADPFLVLRIPGTPNGVKRTKTVSNKKDPTWDERFLFFIDPYSNAQLEIKLIDSHYIVDQNMGVATLPLDKIPVNAGYQPREVSFSNNSKIYLTLSLRDAKDDPDVQSGQALSREECDFLLKRREFATTALQNLLAGDEWGYPRNRHDMPCIAVLGSGGGFRAAAGLAGAFKALHASGVLPCTTYVAGVSGSTWYLSYLYSQRGHSTLGPGAFEAALRDRMCGGWRHLLLPRNLCRYLACIARKAAAGQPVAFTDLFGHLVADTLLGDAAKAPLSAQREELEEAEVPLPVYACVHVNRDISAQVFQEWITFTPYDVCLEKYGATMKTEMFGSKMYCGYAIKKFPEPPMSFLLGLWGSAFSVLFKRLVWDREKRGTFFARSTAEANQSAANDILTYRATREGYASSNNDTGSSNESLQMQSTDEKSSEGETEEHRLLREEMMEKVRLEAVKREREEKEERASRVSKKSKLSRPMSGRKLRQVLRQTSGSPEQAIESDLSEWIPKKKERLFRNFILAKRAKKEETQRGFWRRVLDMLLSEGVWDTRMGRAGLIFNPLRGLVLRPTFPRELEQSITGKDTEPLKGMYTQADPRNKRWFVVDAGLALNIPFPSLLRPQRAVDVFIVFDFSSRPADDASPFDHLLLAEAWARKHGRRFPPIATQVKRFLRETPRECYYFYDVSDPVCPVVLFFPLINLSFREYKAPGIRRASVGDKKMGDFNIYSDARGNYSVTNFHYTHKSFDRLVELMEYNVLQNIAIVTSVLRKSVLRKRSLFPPDAPDEMTLAMLREAELREALRLKREERRKERARKHKERLRQSKKTLEKEENILRKRVKKKKPWDRWRPREIQPSHYTHELADSLEDAAYAANRTDPHAPITVLLNAAFKSACENAREVTGYYNPKKKRD